MTVVGIGSFLDRADRLMTPAEHEELVAYVASNPDAGAVIPETGGVRTLRWGLQRRGKRGGARVIYCYHSERLPVFLLDIYARNEKASLSKADRNAMRTRIPVLVERYTQRRSK